MKEWWRGQPLHTCAKCLQPIIGRRFEVSGDGSPRHTICTTGPKWPEGVKTRPDNRRVKDEANKA